MCGDFDAENGIKLLYLTPEKFSKSNHMRRTLAMLSDRGLVSRFVIGTAPSLLLWNTFLSIMCNFPIYSHCLSLSLLQLSPTVSTPFPQTRRTACLSGDTTSGPTTCPYQRCRKPPALLYCDILYWT